MKKAVSGKGSRVLLVEDDPEWMTTLNDSVIHAFNKLGRGLRLTLKQNFKEAWKALRKDKRWDLLVTDLNISGGYRDKEKLGKRLIELAHEDGVPVIVVSGVIEISVDEVADLFQKYGVRAFFYKGTQYNREDFTAQIAKALDISAPRKPRIDKRRGADRSRVFVVHGRNKQAFEELKKFLKALDLKAWPFEEAADECAGHIEEIVRYGMEHAQAVLVLFTPDERVKLDGRLRQHRDRSDARERMQSRPNVLFEAGMALGLDHEKTVLVTLGTNVSLFSDVAGRHVIRLDDSKTAREKLRRRLDAMGCAVDLVGTSWEAEGDFAACLGNSPRRRRRRS